MRIGIATDKSYSIGARGTPVYFLLQTSPRQYVNIVGTNTLNLPSVSVTSTLVQQIGYLLQCSDRRHLLSDGVSIGHRFDLRPSTSQHHKWVHELSTSKGKRSDYSAFPLYVLSYFFFPILILIVTGPVKSISPAQICIWQANVSVIPMIFEKGYFLLHWY